MPLDQSTRAGIASTVLSSVGQLGSGLIGSIMQKRENARQRDYETQMYERSKQDNLDFWNMSNLYNSPEQQMQRLKAAGLNPNLVYGNGANATVDTLKAPAPNTSNSTTVQNPLHGLDIGSNISQIYDLKVKDAQANLLNQQAQTQKTQQQMNALESELKRLDAVRLRTSNKYDITTLDQRIQTLTAQYDSMLATMANTRSQTRLQDTTRQINIERNNRENQIQPYTIQQLKANIKNLNADTNSTIANRDYTREKITTEKLIQQLNRWEIELHNKGLSKNDGYITRKVASVWSYITQGRFGDALDALKEELKNNFIQNTK